MKFNVGADMNYRWSASQFWRTVNAPYPANRNYWLVGIVFLAIYVTLNTLTGWYQFDGLGITLWSPDNGLSLLLLTESVAFAPFVLIGEVMADTLIHRVHSSFPIIVTADLTLTIGYAVLAIILRDFLKFDPKRVRLSNVLALLVAVPTGATLTSLVYCGVLYIAGSLQADQFYSAVRHFWIGDTVGMIVIIPAATSIYAFFWSGFRRWSRYELVTLLVFAAGMCLGFATLIRDSGTKDFHLFYLLFLPIIWVAMRAGYVGAAIALLATQIALFLTATFLGYDPNELDIFQLLMLVLSITGLLMAAVVSERWQVSHLLREQQGELMRVSSYATAGAMGMTLAHEISQPLSTVATYLHAARRMAQSGATAERVIDALKKAETEARRTSDILERIRDFVSSGGLELSSVDLIDMATKIRALCIEDANARNIEIEVEGVRPVPEVRADSIGMEQVINNLMANAIDASATREDGRGLVLVRISRRGDYVAIEVEDNGPGVVPEMQNTLFEPYQTTKTRGMGLGLPLSLQMVQKHGGVLRWEPKAPEGARFIVELPIEGPENDAR